MAWKKKVCGADTQVCNAPCKIKKLALSHTGATTALIYDEVKSGALTAGKKVWTLRTLTNNLTDEIDFGKEGAFFHEGCYVDWNAGTVLVVYKDAG